MLTGLVSGSVIFLNGQFVYSYSRTQKTVALSSGESEYYALTGAVSEAIGIREAVSFLAGQPTELKAHTDSSAARGIVNCRGVMGRVKHVATILLWLKSTQQEYARPILFQLCSTQLIWVLRA